jgi:peroxiredoxin
VPALRALSGLGYELAVLSNGTPAMIGNCLGNGGLGEFFGERISVDEVRAFKPSPVVYRHAAGRLAITTTDGQAFTVPEAFAGDFAVVLFYRGSWCPYCNAQLRAFERAGQTLSDAGFRVAALSVDDKETTAALVDKHKLAFPVGYGADARAVAELTGAFVNPDPVYLQSTGFVLDPGKGCRERVLKRRHRAARPRRRHRLGPVPARALASRNGVTRQETA